MFLVEVCNRQYNLGVLVQQVASSSGHTAAAWLIDACFDEDADALMKCCSLPYVCSFVDGAVRPIPRPIEGQWLFHSDHKCIHALKLYSVMSPYGITEHLFGPVEGRRHDAHVLQESGLLLKMSII